MTRRWRVWPLVCLLVMSAWAVMACGESPVEKKTGAFGEALALGDLVVKSTDIASDNALVNPNTAETWVWRNGYYLWVFVEITNRSAQASEVAFSTVITCEDGSTYYNTTLNRLPPGADDWADSYRHPLGKPLSLVIDPDQTLMGYLEYPILENTNPLSQLEIQFAFGDPVETRAWGTWDLRGVEISEP